MTMTEGPAKTPAERGSFTALRQKYADERHKRMRVAGRHQYIRLDHQLQQPLRAGEIAFSQRAPESRHATVVCIGGGLGGLVTGARLKEAGISDVRIIDRGSDFGGTWFWNRYPGAQADTHSLVYLPLLEETGHIPSERYPHAPEILEHCRRIGKRYDLYDGALFGTTVTDVTWDPSDSRWVIETDRGDRLTAKFVVMAIGPLNVPKLPGIAGIERFRGHSFHTSRWDYEYTGGSAAGDLMDRLADRRVAVIGTGATAVQCVPHLSRACGQLYVFQRTPSSVDERHNSPIDPDWFHGLSTTPGWQRRWMESFAANQAADCSVEDLVADGWTEPARRIRDALSHISKSERTPEVVARIREELDFERMSRIRARVDAVIENAETAEGLKAWYSQMCKRPCFHDDYLAAFNRDSTWLVDTDGEGVEAITESGILACGVEWEVDCIVYASGFEVGTSFTDRAGYEVTGRDGVTLSSHWANGMRTLHGSQVRKFPNAFVVQPFQASNFLTNISHDIAECSSTIASVVRHMRERGFAEVEPSQKAEDGWTQRILTGAGEVLGSPECTPGLYNNEGDPGETSHRLSAGHPGGPMAFFNYIEQWRSNGLYDGLEFR